MCIDVHKYLSYHCTPTTPTTAYPIKKSMKISASAEHIKLATHRLGGA